MALRVLAGSVAAVLTLTGLGQVPASADVLTTFPDANLRACVRDALIGTGTSNLDRITSLTCTKARVADLTGIDGLRGLRTLALGDNRIATLAGVRFPDRLQYLWLGGNRITTLDGVELPRGLQSLRLMQNGC
jgi:Leucine-rich repeat (LRR) protein